MVEIRGGQRGGRRRTFSGTKVKTDEQDHGCRK